MSKKFFNENKFTNYLKKFDHSELLLNGHDSADVANHWKLFLNICKKGNYLELGCGTGILASFLNNFSNNKIIPFGIDSSKEKIELAKRNNPKFSNNFFVGNYFNFRYEKLKNFSTIAVFLPDNQKYWIGLDNLLEKISNKTSRIIINCYKENPRKRKEIKKYIKNSKLKFDLKNEEADNLEIVLSTSPSWYQNQYKQLE